MASIRELVEAVAQRYRTGARLEKKQILDEFVGVTGFHRKHAIRVLRESRGKDTRRRRETRQPIYDEAVRQALVILWETGDRMCGKRLKPVVPLLVEAMERHGHLQLDPEVRRRLLAMSAATMDRLLKPVRDAGANGRRKPGIRTPLRNSIAVRTFGDWNDPPPGYFEMDFVAHCGGSVAGSHVHSLVVTDIASGWTEGAAMVIRGQQLVIETVAAMRVRLPIPMLGLDVDNDSAFINETLLGYCQSEKLELTRSRAYHKNDQAWIEQKNGAVVRRLAGYGRLEGVEGAAALAKLHAVARLHVNYFQPSFKLKSKTRQGAKVTKIYHAPATPCERLLASDRVSDSCKQQLQQTLAALDPVELLDQIRQAQESLVHLEVKVATDRAAKPAPDLKGFVQSLSTAWREGEVRPTHRKRPEKPRTWRSRIDPFQQVWPMLQQWLNNQPDISAKDLFQRLQEHSGEGYPPGQLRTLQRRVKKWRGEVAQRLVCGNSPEPGEQSAAAS